MPIELEFSTKKYHTLLYMLTVYLVTAVIIQFINTLGWLKNSAQPFRSSCFSYYIFFLRSNSGRLKIIFFIFLIIFFLIQNIFTSEITLLLLTFSSYCTFSEITYKCWYMYCRRYQTKVFLRHIGSIRKFSFSGDEGKPQKKFFF